jgi:hypothetical protein
MTVDLGHDHRGTRQLGQPARDDDVLIAIVPARGYELGVVYQAVPNSALVGYEVVAHMQIYLTGGLELGQIEDIFVGLGNGLGRNVREVYLLVHIDARRTGLRLGVFVRHEQTCRLHTKFFWLIRVCYDRREQIRRVQIATGLEPGKEFFSPFVGGSRFPARMSIPLDA